MKHLLFLIAFFPALALAQPSQGGSTKITDGAQTLDITVGSAAKVDGSAVTQPVSASSLPLPSGAATAANQATGNASLSSIDGKLETCDTEDVTVSSSTLPAGASTESTLSTLNGKVTAVNTGAVVVSSSVLPSGAATESTLSTLNGKVTAVNTGAVVVSSSALPSGAATVAKQPALGTAGTPSSDVITVQGVTSMTALKVDGSGVTQPVSGTFWQTTQPVSGTMTCNAGSGPFPVSDNASSLTVDNGGTFAVQAAQSGTWTVQPGNTANTTAWKVDASSVAVPVTDNSGSLTIDAPVATPVYVRLSDGAAAISTLPVSLASVPSHAVTNAGTFAVQAAESDGANVTLGAKADAKSTATDTTAISAMSVLKQISASVQAPPSQAVTNAGTFAAQAAQSGTWTVQPGNTPNTSAWLTSQTPAASGGLTTYHLVSGASTNAVNVKSTPGQLYCWYLYNSNASARKLAFHNTAGTPTAGASVAWSMVIPGSSAANACSESGIAFSSGIGITTVTGLADSDSTGVATNDLIINLFYK